MYLGMFLAVQNQRMEAVQEMNKALELSQHGVFETAWRGAVLGRLGRRDEARSALAKLQEFSGKQYVAAVLPAIVLAAMGEKNSALDSFEKAFEERSISPWILRDPLIDGIRDEPRFKLILSRMKLPIGRYPSADPR